MDNKCTVIIPCFNEGKRVVHVIEELKKSDYVNEIIVVDDGSETETKNILRNIKDIRLLIHPKNYGKGRAIFSGIEIAQNDLVIFFDADLKNVRSYILDKMVETFFNDKADMVLSVSKRDIFYMRWIGFAQAYTGQRVLRKSILMQHPEIFRHNKYTIEPAINLVFFDKYKVSFIYNDEIKPTYKIQKEGLTGLFKDFDMYYNHIKFLGIKGFFQQLQFAKKMCN